MLAATSAARRVPPEGRRGQVGRGTRTDNVGRRWGEPGLARQRPAMDPIMVPATDTAPITSIATNATPEPRNGSAAERTGR
ncbi:hypothetical protein LTR94_017515 [Friedmanniomyces endolithicus]|nr:hypothetical protein LTR94_017515 [Friedmanniomyces endolithicus]